MLDRQTGQISPARCGRNRCGVCGPINAWLIGQAIAQSKPERMIRLSLVGNDSQTIRARMNRVSYELRRSVEVFELVWSCEANPKGTGHHVHGYQRGSFVPQRVLSAVADRCGMGRNTDIRRFVPRSNGPIVYNTKLVTGVSYGMKAAEKAESLAGYLDINGGRMVHASKGFWLDADGNHTTQQGAVESWRSARANAEGNSGQWEFVRRDQVCQAMSVR